MHWLSSILGWNLLYNEVHSVKAPFYEPGQTKVDYIILLISVSPTKVCASAVPAIAVNTCLGVFRGRQNMLLGKTIEKLCLWYF